MGSLRSIGLWLAVALGLGGCAGEATGLEHYTDPGDGCAQAVSAISYADDTLKPLGQEYYQDWSDSVRSRLAAVGGTIALEVKDFPSSRVLSAARRVQDDAERVQAAGVSHSERVELLRRYRRDAAQLVLLCADQVDPTAVSTPSTTSSGGVNG